MSDFLYFYLFPLLIISLIYFSKFKKITPGFYILLVLIVSGLGSFFLLGFWIDHYPKLTGSPFLYLIAVLLLMIIPVYNFDKKVEGLKTISQVSKINHYAVKFFIVISIIPFIENFYHLLTGSVFNAANVVDIYESKQDTNIVDWLDPVSRKLNTILQLFFIYIVHLFFYCLKQRRTRDAMLLSVAILNNFTMAMNTSSRAFMMGQVFIFIYVFIVYRSFLSRKILELSKKIFFAFLLVFTIFFSYITISRFENTVKSDISVFQYVSLYAGEGVINFNNELWYTKSNTNGDTNFSLFKKVIGLKTFENLLERRDYWETRTKIRTHIFYTGFGDVFFDLGPIGCFVFFLVLSLMLRKFLKKQRLSFEDVFLFSFCAYFLIYGVTCNPFKTYWGNVVLVTNFLLYFILNSIPYEKKR